MMSHRIGDEEDNLEAVPLTPRESTSSDTSSSVLHDAREPVHSYLRFFQTPPAAMIHRRHSSRSFGRLSSGRSRRSLQLDPVLEGAQLNGPLTSRSEASTMSSSLRSPLTHTGDDDQTQTYEEGDEDEDDCGQPDYVPDRYRWMLSGQENSRRHSLSLSSSMSQSQQRPPSTRSVSSYASSSVQSRLSLASHLFGENLVELGEHEDLEKTGFGRMESARSVSFRPTPIYTGRYPRLYHNLAWVESVVDKARNYMFGPQRPPLSPRSRNLTDLQYLTAQHRSKVQQLAVGDDQHYDLVLVLSPQEVHAFWSTLLDFRVELLGEDVVQAMEQQWAETTIGNDTSSTQSHSTESEEESAPTRKTNAPFSYSLETVSSDTAESSSEHSSSNSSKDSSDSSGSHTSEAMDTVEVMHTPSTGMHLRRRITSPASASSQNPQTHSHFLMTPENQHIPSSHVVGSTNGRSTPGLYSVADSSRISTARSRWSVFERAVGSTAHSPGFSHIGSSRSVVTAQDHDVLNTSTITSTPLTHRRRWGNRTIGGGPQPSSTKTQLTTLSPARSLHNMRTNSLPTATASPSLRTVQTMGSVGTKKMNPYELRMEDVPSQLVPRGIAQRKSGVAAFTAALRRGIIVRRHRPTTEAEFCRISSKDGGDTIQFHFVGHAEAMRALAEHRSLISVEDRHDVEVTVQPWALPPSIPAVSTKLDSHGLVDPISKVSRGGHIKAADLVKIQPGSALDRRTKNGSLGTSSLRRSKSSYHPDWSFSVVTRSTQRLARNNNTDIAVYEYKWEEGGNEANFKYLDIEAATEEDYWLLVTGLVRLQRDAVRGRFAKQRAAGIEGHWNRMEAEICRDAALHRDEFHEPVTVGCLEKMVVKWRDIDTSYMEGFTLPSAVAPPSDYFLGFRSPGTAIWARLRHAGLETQRVYSLDPRRVMIKVRCPSDRLIDVAEVLRVKLKTRDGSFAPFREENMGAYDSPTDPLEAPPLLWNSGFQFCSALRQTITTFIIGSRIRDSGAELGHNTDLGKMIQACIPLHMPDKVNAIFYGWFYFWRLENWNGPHPNGYECMEKLERASATAKSASPTKSSSKDMSEGLSISTGPSSDSGDSSGRHPLTEIPSNDMNPTTAPNVFVRFLVGCFYQPLDSIEEYFGEKVCFYFAWLQHTSAYLVVLAIIGFFVFLCQVGSGEWDHPLRPYFAMVVMLWTCIVLVNWKKRANFLAHRWGTLNFKEQETARPQFHGDEVKDEITGEIILKYPKWKRWIKYAVSFPITILFTAGTLVVILAVHANRDLQMAHYLDQRANPESAALDIYSTSFKFKNIGYAKPITDVEIKGEHFRDPYFWFIVVGMPALLGLCLPLLNFILMRLSVMLNDFENYRTESEYRSYLIIKVFSFRFVCYFATLYYYAFISIDSPQAIDNGILRVGTSVLVYTTVAQYWQNFLHVCFPILIRKIRMRHRRKRLCRELRGIELEEEEIGRLADAGVDDELLKRQVQLINKRLLLEQAQDDVWLEIMFAQHDSFPEYIQAVVQFTYVSCFSVVLPITPLICLINYLVSMRLDAYKLCKERRRPIAEKTGGIGVWEHLLHIVAVISILTNCWLMGFTNAQFVWIGKQVGRVGLFAIIVGWEHVMLLIKYILQTSVSPLPKSVRDAVKREQYLLDQQRNSSMRDRRMQHQEELQESGRNGWPTPSSHESDTVSHDSHCFLASGSGSFASADEQHLRDRGHRQLHEV